MLIIICKNYQSTAVYNVSKTNSWEKREFSY